jgi:hypothetical protein
VWQIADIEACLPVEIPVSLKSSITAWLRQHLTPMEHAGSHTFSEAGSNTLSVHIPSPRGALSDSDASLLWGPQTNGPASVSQSQLDVDTSDLDDNAISYNFTLDKWHEEVQERFDSIVTEGGVDWPKQLLPATKNSALRTIMKMPYTDTLFLFRGDAWASISQATAESDLMKRRIIHMIREIPTAGHQTPENPVSSSHGYRRGTGRWPWATTLFGLFPGFSLHRERPVHDKTCKVGHQNSRVGVQKRVVQVQVIGNPVRRGDGQGVVDPPTAHRSFC